MKRHVRAALVGAAFVIVASFQLSATPGFWQAATQADFLRGDVENLSVDEHGRLMLGPETTRVYESGAPFVWTLLPGEDGSVFLGTGNEGKVVRVDRSGAGTVFFDSGEMEVHALAPAPDGGLYVGTSPDGRIYRVDSKGQSTTFFDPEEKYIWSLAVDRKGAVFAATGDKGIVYRIAPDGKGAPFYETKTTHAITLTFDPSGNLLVGTGAPGRVFRVDPTGRGFLVLDTQFQEIRALRFDSNNVLYVAAQSGRPGQGGDAATGATTTEPAAPAAVPSVSTEITSIAIIDVPVSPQASTSTTSAADRRAPTGAVFRVLPDGLWDLLWESRDDAPYDIAIERDGVLLVATGSKGKIFRLAGDPIRATLLTRVTAQQAVMLHQTPNRTLIATANPGELVALSSERAPRGTYESDVKDARVVSTWGTIAWRATTPAGTRVEVQTRSGNTRTPDDAWSAWSTAYTDPNGSRITSPNARYLQWRAMLAGNEGDTPILTSITAAYLQRNIRPDVASITVHPPGVVFQKPFSSGEAEIAGYNAETMERRVANAASPTGVAGAPTLGRRTYQKGLQTFIWKADDENGDELTYSVLYRREGETTWKTLASDLTDTILVWDTSSAPNGAYVVKVVASDRKSNPTATALEGERESASFDVDNSAPAISMGAAKRDANAFVVPFEVRDEDSVVTRVEYSVDSQPWQGAFPQDGMLDARHERFSLRLDAALAGRTVVVRAADAMNNVGTGEVVLK